MKSVRIAKWDNAKFILIILVVLGHIAELYCDKYTAFKSAFLFIYSFHMPAFIFIAGLFGKKLINSEKLNWVKLLPFLVLCLLLNFFRFASFYIFDRSAKFSLSKISNISWFLFALFAFYIITYLVKNFDKRYILLIAVIVACIAGYDKKTGDYFALSRIIAFYPFFLAGYCLEEESLRNFLNKKSVRIISAVVIVGFLLICIFFVHKFYWLRPLITGKNSFYKLEVRPSFGGVYRLLYYLVAFVLVGAFLSLVPNKEIKFFSSLGSHTLSVYFWHLPVIQVLYEVGAFKPFTDKSEIAALIFAVALAVLFSVIFSLKPFRTPVNYIMKPKLREKS